MRRLLFLFILCVSSVYGSIAASAQGNFVCRLKGQIYLQESHFLTHGQDAWIGPGILSCGEIGEGKRLEIPVLLRYEGRVRGYGAFRRELYTVLSNEVTVASPDNLIGVFPTLGGSLKGLGLSAELEFIAQLPHLGWTIRLGVKDVEEPSLAAFLRLGELTIELMKMEDAR
jgi:hypothetical protein